MYQYAKEKRLFDEWGRWAREGWNVNRALGVNDVGASSRSALDRIGEARNAPGPLRSAEEPPMPRYDLAVMERISWLMAQWRTQMPTVHAALMARHRQIYNGSKSWLPSFGLKPDVVAAWHLYGGRDLEAIRKLYRLCDCGYRILHGNLIHNLLLDS